MGLLKQKIARALHHQQLLLEVKKTKATFSLPLTSFSPQVSSKEHIPSPSVEAKKSPATSSSGRRRSCTGNNIMKNYCRALANFGLSPIAEPYMRAEEESLSPEAFRAILEAKKKKVNCIKTLRSLLLQDGRESKEMKAFKSIFQKVCLAFLKFFCVNWIWNSKVADKMKHLKYRGKMLRRVQNPQFFTYLEDFSKKEKHN